MKSPKILGLVELTALMISLVVFLSSCGKENSTSPVENHTIYISNEGTSNPYGVHAKQFTSLKLTPTDSSSESVTYNFVSNPGTTISVKVKVPTIKQYKIVVYTAEGQFIFWNSIAMAPDGTTTIKLLANSNGFTDNSRCNGIPPDGSNIM